jgi:hypothetical protein
MFRSFDPKQFDRLLTADARDLDVVCMSSAPNGMQCTLEPQHDPTHLAGVGDGYAVGEWDDDRSTDA